VVAVIAAQVTDLGGRVYSSRSLPIPGNAVDGGTAAMPCAKIYSDRIIRERRADDAFDVTVPLLVVVQVEHATTEEVESSLDALGAAVETAVFADETLNDAVMAMVRHEAARQIDSTPERVSGSDMHQFTFRWTELW
jgi:hypothetical protein